MELSLTEDQIRAIVAHLAHLRAAYGEAFAEPDLVEPNGDYFPDEFSLDPEGVDRLLRRMLGYAPLSEDLEIGLGFIEPDGEVKGGGCGSGACGTGGLKEVARGGAVETEDGYAALVHVQDVGEPAILTAALARAAGRIVLFEADEDVDPRDEGALSELTALASGLGLILLNGACVYKKGCGGMKRHQATFLGLEEIALGLALFVRATKNKPGVVRRHLEVTQKETFDAALEWVDGQPALVAALADRPETLEDGVFPFEEKKGLFSRLFARKSSDDEPSVIHVRPRERSEEERRRLAEAKALVDEALSEG
ncbi:MAG: hypothetical protein KF764_02670 [Labilithrix sp.]|nr:hypothetical protein [Labilithrix sp.]MBX3220809.1 hypothetical protein [Labilithrix sp.]